MDLLLDDKIFGLYFNNKLNPNIDQTGLIINNILENQNNKFVFNLNFYKFIEKEISQDIVIREFFKQYIKKLIQSRVITVDSTNNDNIEIELIGMYNKYKTLQVPKSGFIARIVLTKSNLTINHNFASIDNYIKPNFDWFVIETAKVNPNCVETRYSDYTNQAEIIDYLEKVYKLSEQIDYVNIFNRYCNLNHDLLNFFHQIQEARIEYITLSASLAELKNYYNALKSTFRRVQIYTGRPIYLHERRIMFNGIIIEFDDDFENIVYNAPNWKIQIYVCRNLEGQYLRKKANFFNRIENRILNP